MSPQLSESARTVFLTMRSRVAMMKFVEAGAERSGKPTNVVEIHGREILEPTHLVLLEVSQFAGHDLLA